MKQEGRGLKTKTSKEKEELSMIKDGMLMFGKVTAELMGYTRITSR